ncbi:hypothetical protein [Psychrosphaera algicola]|uniref:Uncharacterized protein n=1 Tax=Psychrosphaera algicola TaxID=3023714 RepID=A0ABT5FDH8_9GAMM|nr:hypothetical protein [Psychrosphaera sp. G1-22]MDC2889591.1 hypothetical protein [Psychrosphaera sp. G1-22]
MAKELTSLLSTSSDVRIIGVTILAPEKIDIDVKDIEQSDALPEYYRHGFEVVVSGEYFNLMNLVKKYCLRTISSQSLISTIM